MKRNLARVSIDSMRLTKSSGRVSDLLVSDKDPKLSFGREKQGPIDVQQLYIIPGLLGRWW